MKQILIVIILFLTILAKAANYYICADSTLNTPNDLPVLSPGDSVFLHAGEKFRETWNITESGEEGNYIYFGRYGEGVNPVIVGSTQAITWTETATSNVWQTATSLVNESGDTYAGRIFFEYNNGIQDTIGYGDYKTYTVGFTNLVEEFDYTVNGTTHYVYSTTDPDEAYDAIEVTQREACITYEFNTYLEWNGIDVRYGQRQGFFEGYPSPRGVTDLIWRNLNVSYIGAKGSGSAYGITAFASNILIENCTFSDNGRRAISINTYTDNDGGRRIENIIIRNNTFKRGYHTTSLDLSTMNRTGDTVMNVYFYNNYIDDTEIDEITVDWGGSNQLFTQGGINTSIMTNIYIVGNVFTQSTSRNILLENSVTHYIWNNTFIALNNVRTTSIYGSIGTGGADTIDLRNNILYDNIADNSIENNLIHGYLAGNVYYPYRDYNLYYTLFPGVDRNFTSIDVDGSHYFYNTEQWDDYRTDFPLYDPNSPIPQDPYFTDFNNEDYTLSDSSIVRFAGDVIDYLVITDPFGEIDTVNKYDIDGIERSRISPSVGAYEFNPIRTGFMSDIDTITSTGGTPYNTIDKNFSTSYSEYGTDGSTYITYKFNDTIWIDNIAMSFGAGDSRNTYFTIAVSLNGTNYTNVLTDTSRGNTVYLENFFFEQVPALYVRILGRGNSATGFNTYTEVYFPPLNSTISPDAIQNDSSINVLFIGNSYTDNAIKETFQNIVASHGWPSPNSFDAVIGGGYLWQHETDVESMELINQGDWDYVVLQEYSQQYVEDTSEFFEAATWFYDTIKVTSPNAKIVLYETWATISDQEDMYDTWDAALISDWDSVQNLISTMYEHCAIYISDSVSYEDKNDTLIAPVGDFWGIHFNSDTLFRLHGISDNHANDTGEYYNSLILYNTIYNCETYGAGNWNNTSSYAASHFQQLIDNQSFTIESGEALSSLKNIISFTITGQEGSTTINTTEHTVSLTMPYGTDFTDLSPVITISGSAIISPLSGVSQDFTNPVTYTVTAEDLTEQEWIVTISEGDAPASILRNNSIKINGKYLKSNGSYIINN